MKKITKNKSNPKDKGHHLALDVPKLDKLSAVVKLKDEQLAKVIYHSILAEAENLEFGVGFAKGSGKYPLSVKVYYAVSNDALLHSGCPFVLLQMTHTKSNKRHIRVEWNPSTMTEHGAEYISTQFLSFCGLTFFELLYHAKFTRMDWCRDIYGMHIEDYPVRGRYWKAMQCFCNTVTGKLETITFGQSSGNQAVIYDKATELYGDNSGGDTTRVEIRLRNNITPKELVKIANPFARVEFYSAYCQYPPFGQAHWGAFLDSCHLRGINNAIKAQPAGCRSALKKVLSGLPVGWWYITPEEWQQYLFHALHAAHLMKIPAYAPPLDYSVIIGKAA